MSALRSDPARQAPLDAEAAILAASALLMELRDGHARLEARAAHVEAELCRTNDELASKVDELERVTRNLEAVLRAIPTGVVVYDAAGAITRVNPAAAKILGVAPEALVGRDLEALGPESGLAGGTAEGRPVEVTCGDGRPRVLARCYSTVSSSDGSLIGAVEALDDQTELAHAEDRMRRLSRAAALGTMVGGVAHEVRNPLHAISGFADLLLREVDSESRAARHAKRIRAGVADLEAIVASMLGVAGHGARNIERVDVRPVIEAAVSAALAGRNMARPSTVDGAGAPPAYDVTVTCADVQVTCDAVELRQAIRNLIANACDVQAPGGRVAVEVNEERGQGVLIRVHDAGPGVAAAAREHLFDPFYTTRAEGTGLGLALVSRVAELNGGSVELLDAPSPLGGATFVLRLPESPTAGRAMGAHDTSPTH
ncbi:MAG: ATP-binding protein [Planctomycetota bacterium]